MTTRLSPAERDELAGAIGTAPARALEPTLIRLLADYAGYHSEMTVTEFREQATPLIAVLRKTGRLLHDAPGDISSQFYWWERLQDAIAEAMFDLEGVCLQAPTHRAADRRRMLLLEQWATHLVRAGVRLSEYEDSPFAHAFRVAMFAMDRLVRRRYRGRPPTHDTVQPAIRAVKRVLRRRAATAATPGKIRPPKKPT